MAAGLRCSGFQLPANARQFNKAVDRAQETIFGDVVFESEAVEQRTLPDGALAHHLRIPSVVVRIESGRRNDFKRDFFNGIHPKRSFAVYAVSRLGVRPAERPRRDGLPGLQPALHTEPRASGVPLFACSDCFEGSVWRFILHVR